MEYDGKKTLTDMIEYLKTKELKMIKNDLSTFIKNKEGENWESMRE